MVHTNINQIKPPDSHVQNEINSETFNKPNWHQTPLGLIPRGVDEICWLYFKKERKKVCTKNKYRQSRIVKTDIAEESTIFSATIGCGSLCFDQ